MKKNDSATPWEKTDISGRDRLKQQAAAEKCLGIYQIIKTCYMLINISISLEAGMFTSSTV